VPFFNALADGIERAKAQAGVSTKPKPKYPGKPIRPSDPTAGPSKDPKIAAATAAAKARADAYLAAKPKSR